MNRLPSAARQTRPDLAVERGDLRLEAAQVRLVLGGVAGIDPLQGGGDVAGRHRHGVRRHPDVRVPFGMAMTGITAVLLALPIPGQQPHAARHVHHLDPRESPEDGRELDPLELEGRVPHRHIEPRPAERRHLPRGERIVDVGVAGRDHHVHPHALAADPLDEIGLRRHAHGDADAGVVRGGRGEDRPAGGQREQEEEAPHAEHAAHRP